MGCLEAETVLYMTAFRVSKTVLGVTRLLLGKKVLTVVPDANISPIIAGLLLPRNSRVPHLVDSVLAQPGPRHRFKSPTGQFQCVQLDYSLRHKSES